MRSRKGYKPRFPFTAYRSLSFPLCLKASFFNIIWIRFNNFALSIDLFHAALVWFRNTFELSTTTGLDDRKLGRTTFSAGALQKHIFVLCQIWLTTGASGHVTDISISGSTDGVAISHTLSMLISLVGSAVVTGADFIPLGRCDFACGSHRGDRVIWLWFAGWTAFFISGRRTLETR